MHGSYYTVCGLQYLRKYTEDLHFRSCSSVKFETLLCLASPSIIEASGKQVILLLYYSGSGVRMEAWSLC